jgi:hypothetical protein
LSFVDNPRPYVAAHRAIQVPETPNAGLRRNVKILDGRLYEAAISIFRGTDDNQQEAGFFQLMGKRPTVKGQGT